VCIQRQGQAVVEVLVGREVTRAEVLRLHARGERERSLDIDRPFRLDVIEPLCYISMVTRDFQAGPEEFTLAALVLALLLCRTFPPGQTAL
jgi:hypothetical protein